MRALDICTSPRLRSEKVLLAWAGAVLVSSCVALFGTLKELKAEVQGAACYPRQDFIEVGGYRRPFGQHANTGLERASSFSTTRVAQADLSAVSAGGRPRCIDLPASPISGVTTSVAVSEEFNGPFDSWRDLQRDFKAVGDGKADDTDAIQAALNFLRDSETQSPILYIPKGIYRVTKTLTVASARSIGVIGEDPATTIIKWNGRKGDTILHINGVSYSKFDRLTFDGNGVAGALVDQSLVPNTPGAQFDTGNEYADDVFQNGTVGIQGGQFGVGAAESIVLRCRFIHNTYGISLKNFNALDWWVWYSYFRDNQTGITNTEGAGNFHAYNNVFENSVRQDLAILNTGTFNFRDNLSVGSARFLTEVYYYTNAAVTRLQGNVVFTPSVDNGCGGCSIYQGNMGPTVMTDNTIVSPKDARRAAVVIEALDPPDCVSAGNTFTQQNTLECGSNSGAGRIISLDDRVVAPSSINARPPSLPEAPIKRERPLFEIKPGSRSADIALAMKQAAAQCGRKPIVHFPHGNYAVEEPIIVPPACDIQLMGDGDHTRLLWLGYRDGAVIVLTGPSRAVLRDFAIDAQNGTGVKIENADQPGSRIFMQQVSALHAASAGVFVDGLDHALVELHNFQLAWSSAGPGKGGVGIIVAGGPLAQSGVPQGGKTNLFAGSGGNNFVSYRITKGATVHVRDAWYESNTAGPYAEVSDNSTVTFEGSRMAMSGASGGLADPTEFSAVKVHDLSCAVTVLSSAPDSDIALSGALSGNVWVVGNNFNTSPRTFTNQSGSDRAFFSLNRKYVAGYGSKQIPDATPTPNSDLIRRLLAQSRSSHPDDLKDLAHGLTDVRFHRVTIERARIGVHINR